MITVYYLISDGGDGSATVNFFRSKELAERLRGEDENFYMNEGVGSFQVPDVGTITFEDKYYG